MMLTKIIDIESVSTDSQKCRVTLTDMSGVRKQMKLGVSPRLFEAGLNDYINKGMLIQEAFPALSDDEREFLLTGMTPEEWDALFA